MTLLPFAILFVAGIEAGHFVLPVGSTGAPAFWIPSGLLLGGLVLSSRRRWPTLVGIAAGVVIASVVAHGGSPLPAVVLAMTTALQGAGGAWLLQRLAPVGFTLNRLADASALVASSLAAAVIGALLPVVLTPSRAVDMWQDWALASLLGLVLFAPLVIAWRHEWRDRFELNRRARVVELAIALALTIVVSQLVFGGVVPEAVQLPSLVLPFFIWSAFRFGPAASSLTVLVICLTGVGYTTHGLGPLAMPDVAVDYPIFRGQAAAGMAAVCFLLLASVAAERAQALAEIRTLRGFIPICAWCHKVRDDEGFWQRLETYLGANTDATISHSICPSCSDKQHQAVENQAVGAGNPWKI
jgi:integral membrane sensor domain MASE1